MYFTTAFNSMSIYSLIHSSSTLFIHKLGLLTNKKYCTPLPFVTADIFKHMDK